MDSPVDEGSNADVIGNLMNVDGGCKKKTHGSSSTLSGDLTAHATAAARVNSYKCPWYKPDYNQQAVVAGGGSTLFPGTIKAFSDQWSSVRTCTFDAGDACQILDGDIEYFDTWGSTWVNVAVYVNTGLGQRLAASHSKSASGCY